MLRVVPMPADANPSGDIFGGWIMSQVDIAGSIPAIRLAKGRVATVAVNSFVFKQPVLIGDLVSFYAEVVRVGRTSITVDVEVYAQRGTDRGDLREGDGGHAHLRGRGRRAAPASGSHDRRRAKAVELRSSEGTLSVHQRTKRRGGGNETRTQTNLRCSLRSPRRRRWRRAWPAPPASPCSSRTPAGWATPTPAAVPSRRTPARSSSIRPA